MKRIIALCMVALAMLAVPSEAQAQKFLKKINKGLEKLTAPVQATTPAAEQPREQPRPVAPVEQPNGVKVFNPLASAVDVELVGAYGVSTSENYGKVELVLKVIVKIPEEQISLGGNMSSKGTIAFDADGNSYKMQYPSVPHSYDVTEGLPVRITLTGSDAFRDVRKSATVFPVLKLFTHLNYDTRDEIVFRDVPVLWDVEH